jgi:hypothetical protein
VRLEAASADAAAAEARAAAERAAGGEAAAAAARAERRAALLARERDGLRQVLASYDEEAAPRASPGAPALLAGPGASHDSQEGAGGSHDAQWARRPAAGRPSAGPAARHAVSRGCSVPAPEQCGNHSRARLCPASRPAAVSPPARVG